LANQLKKKVCASFWKTQIQSLKTTTKNQ